MDEGNAIEVETCIVDADDIAVVLDTHGGNVAVRDIGDHVAVPVVAMLERGYVSFRTQTRTRTIELTCKCCCCWSWSWR